MLDEFLVTGLADVDLELDGGVAVASDRCGCVLEALDLDGLRVVLRAEGCELDDAAGRVGMAEVQAPEGLVGLLDAEGGPAASLGVLDSPDGFLDGGDEAVVGVGHEDGRACVAGMALELVVELATDLVGACEFFLVLEIAGAPVAPGEAALVVALEGRERDNLLAVADLEDVVEESAGEQVGAVCCCHFFFVLNVVVVKIGNRFGFWKGGFLSRSLKSTVFESALWADRVGGEIETFWW